MKNLTFHVNTASANKLKKMASALETDLSGVIKLAFTMLESVVVELKAGNSISVTKDGTIVKEIIGIWEKD